MIFIQGPSINFFFERGDLNIIELRESYEIDLLFGRSWNGPRALIQERKGDKIKERLVNLFMILFCASSD